MKHLIGSALAVAAGLGVAAAFAQQAASTQFEVASIKRSDPNDRRMMFRMTPGGGINLYGVTLKALVEQAYDVREFQISGGPGWIGADKYDINAKAENASTAAPADPRQLSEEQRKTVQEQTRLRLKALLADRFQIKLHWDAKEESGYALLLGKGELKLRAAAPEAKPSMGMSGKGHLTWTSSTLADVASSLTQFIGRPVVDMTGIPERFDIALDAAPDSMPGFHAAPDHDSEFPTIFVALRDLGLNLQSQKVSVKYLVIDSALKLPTEN